MKFAPLVKATRRGVEEQTGPASCSDGPPPAWHLYVVVAKGAESVAGLEAALAAWRFFAMGCAIIEFPHERKSGSASYLVLPKRAFQLVLSRFD